MHGLVTDVSSERDESEREVALIRMMLLQKRSESFLGNKDMTFSGSERSHQSDNWQQREHPSSDSSDYHYGVSLLRGGPKHGPPADLRLTPVSSGGKASTSLPLKLVSMLSNPDFSDVVTWMPHGRAWKILDLDAFTQQVLPVFFDCGSYPNNFHTFVKMLKFWGFRQFTRGPDASAYFNPLFIRGMPHLRRMMRPTQQCVPLHDSNNEPDFYILPPPSTPGFTSVDPQGRLGTYYPSSPLQQPQTPHDFPCPSMIEQQRRASTAKVQALRSLMNTPASPNDPASLPVLSPLPDHDVFMRADRRYPKPTLSWHCEVATADHSPAAALNRSDPYWQAAASIPYNSAAYYGNRQHRHSKLVAELQAAQDLHDQTLRYLISSEKHRLPTPSVLPPTSALIPAPPSLPSTPTVQIEANTAPQTPVGSSNNNEERLSVKIPVNMITSSSCGASDSVATPSPLAQSATTSASKSSSPSSATKKRRKWLPPLDAGGVAPSESRKKKKPRRKWLPPLGPKETSVSAASQCSWYFSNPEAFAALNDAAKKKGCL